MKHMTALIITGALIATTTLAQSDQRNPFRNLPGFLEEHNALLSWDVAGGYANNVYLTSDDEDADLFLTFSIELEAYRRTTDMSLYLDGSIEREQYMSESDASETYITLVGDVTRDLTDVAIGATETLSYDDYRSFDEEGGILPSGEHEAFASDTRLFAIWTLPGEQDLEGGVSLRLKNYTEADYDFTETGLDIVYRWSMSDRWSLKARYEREQQDYDDWQALSADGTTADDNPTSELAITRRRFELIHKPNKKAQLTAFVRQTTTEENFEEEASYKETGIGVSATVQLGAHYALDGYATTYTRDYDNRLTADADTQEDDFMTLTLRIERRLQGTVSAYASGRFSTRDSNAALQDYTDLSLIAGIRALM